MKTTFLRFALLSATLTAAACSSEKDGGSALASNYPPNYPMRTWCQDSAEFRICQMEVGTRSALSVLYRGHLKDAAKVSVYVKLNGREGTFPMDKRSAEGHYAYLTDGATTCDWANQSASWDCEYASGAMADLFFYAKREYWDFNAWDVELAVVDGSNNWDSRYGANYQFRFEER